MKRSAAESAATDAAAAATSGGGGSAPIGTSYSKPTERPDYGGKYSGFDHVHFWVSNALQAATFYVARFGFEPYAYAGLETGSRDVATHVVRQNKIVFAFSSALNPDGEVAKQRGAFVSTHGDAARDVAFAVDNCRKMYETAVARGAESVRAPVLLRDEGAGDDAPGVWVATVKTYGDTVHTFVQRDAAWSGTFLPGFRAVTADEPLTRLSAPVGLNFIDHVVGNQPDGEMTSAAQWYEDKLQFHRFWSVDDSVLHTEYSALRSIVMVEFDESVKMPINEPAPGKRKSQIQEYVDYFGGAGVQHIALNTNDIISAVRMLRSRGMTFLNVPDTYYKMLRERLAASPVTVKEDLDVIEELNILVDFDDNGYLLQLFSRTLQDKPTYFLEVIQRANHNGFGAGNFKALFESIEREQEERGNL